MSEGMDGALVELRGRGADRLRSVGVCGCEHGQKEVGGVPRGTFGKREQKINLVD